MNLLHGFSVPLSTPLRVSGPSNRSKDPDFQSAPSPPKRRPLTVYGSLLSCLSVPSLLDPSDRSAPLLTRPAHRSRGGRHNFPGKRQTGVNASGRSPPDRTPPGGYSRS